MSVFTLFSVFATNLLALAEAKGVVQTRCQGQARQEFLRRLLPFKAGVPSRDALSDAASAINRALLAERFAARVETLRDPATAQAVALAGRFESRSRLSVRPPFPPAADRRLLPARPAPP